MSGTISEIYDWAAKNPALVISGLSLTVATLGFLLTHFARFRAGFKHTALTVGGWLGFTRARYKASFLKAHGELHNIYVDRVERLNIVATYVPLHIISPTAGLVNKPAIDVLLDASEVRIVILREPGAGKATLLKSFGISLVSHDLPRQHQREKSQEAKALQRLSLTPIYVELRDFAARMDKYPTLADYIIGYVLDRQHLSGADCRGFLRQLLARGECVVLLDALDEVGADDYEAIRRAVHVFLSDTSDELPTSGARVVMTSRYQNFLSVYNDWVPSAFPRYHALAPFSDEDIQHFLQKRADGLPPGKTPAALWEEIRYSNPLHLHRTPLILTVSLGLYKIIPRYTIPESVARFYEEITKELLQRHDFRTRPYLPKRNAFPSEFKMQFLREFALKAATRAGRFDECSFEEMSHAFASTGQRNARLSGADGYGFLNEIIDNAGLLRRVSDSGIYVFAHRSFHEYFAALQLSKNAEQGARELIGHAEDPLWRQLTVFFASMDHDQHDLLLCGLAEKNPELAGYCLAAANNVSAEAALAVIARLDAVVSRDNAVGVLGALSAICRNSGGRVRERALGVIGRVLTQVLVLGGTTALLGLKRDDLIRLAHDLAATGARNIIDSCVTLSTLVEDDPRIIISLWHCLGYFTEEPDAPEARWLVIRLLEMAQTPEGFEALQVLPTLAPPFITSQMRPSVYPLLRGLSKESNLVTLLAWADHTHALPEKQNGFLQALAQRQEAQTEWRRLEREMEKTPIAIPSYPLGLLLFWGGTVACIIYLGRRLLTLGPGEFVGRYFILFDSLLLKLTAMVIFGLVLGVAAGLIQMGLTRTRLSLSEASNPHPPANPFLYILDHELAWLKSSGNYFWDSDTFYALLFLMFMQLPFILTGIGMSAGSSTVARLAAGALLTLAIFWLPATRAFESRARIDLRRRSKLASMILADASSQPWIRKSA